MKAGHNILVVEDEPKIREGLKDFLEFHDFLATVAIDGLSAERIVDNERFDLILLDLMLPGISGEQLCQKWRRQGISTPIIMLTAKGQENERVKGLDMGADDYVTKPFRWRNCWRESGRSCGGRTPGGRWAIVLPSDP
jgi:DNA-binding response OmpR family regulator